MKSIKKKLPLIVGGLGTLALVLVALVSILFFRNNSFDIRQQASVADGIITVSMKQAGNFVVGQPTQVKVFIDTSNANVDAVQLVGNFEGMSVDQVSFVSALDDPNPLGTPPPTDADSLGDLLGSDEQTSLTQAEVDILSKLSLSRNVVGGDKLEIIFTLDDIQVPFNSGSSPVLLGNLVFTPTSLTGSPAVSWDNVKSKSTLYGQAEDSLKPPQSLALVLPPSPSPSTVPTPIDPVECTEPDGSPIQCPPIGAADCAPGSTYVPGPVDQCGCQAEGSCLQGDPPPTPVGGPPTPLPSPIPTPSPVSSPVPTPIDPVECTEPDGSQIQCPAVGAVDCAPGWVYLPGPEDQCGCEVAGSCVIGDPPPSPVSCPIEYGQWSECTDGVQHRSVVHTDIPGCVIQETDEISRSCGEGLGCVTDNDCGQGLECRSPENNQTEGGVCVTQLHRADFNDDGKVNIMDISILVRYFFQDEPSVDLNSDGRVDIIDYSMMIRDISVLGF